MHAPEAERLVESLRAFPLEEVGSEAWMKQHEILQKLNFQSHRNAMESRDEFVMEAFISFEKLPVLMHELLVIEAWKDHVLPRIQDRAAKKNPLRAYFLMYHEATLLNLLEVFLYYDYCTEAIGDALVDLVDYCVRKAAWLLRNKAPAPAGEEYMGKTAKELASAAEKKSGRDGTDLQKQADDISFRMGVVAITCLRYLSEHVAKLPLSVMTRILDTHDVMLLMVPLIESPPWTRRNPKGQWQKFQGQAWGVVEPVNLLKLTQTEGQVWLTLYNLMMDPECRKKYYFHSHRKATLLRVRKYLNQVLLDQLPMLAEVQRYMDELQIMDPPAPTSIASSSLVLEQVPAIYEAIMKGVEDWDVAASRSFKVAFAVSAAKDASLRRLAGVYQMDALEGLVDGSGAGAGEDDSSDEEDDSSDDEEEDDSDAAA